MAKRIKTQAEREYTKQHKRLQQAVRRAEKRGYYFSESPIPSNPKRITKKSVEKLSKIKPQDLLKKAKYINTETGELVSYKKGLEQEKQNRKEKAKRTRELKKLKLEQEQHKVTQQEQTQEQEQVISEFAMMSIFQFRQDISHFPTVASPLLNRWVDALIQQKGIEDVAEMLQTGAENGYRVTYKTAYNETALYEYMDAMLEFLPDEGTLFADDFMQSFRETMSDALEQEEDWESPQ